MKLFEQLKSNASRMAVYAILVATALCGIAAPVYALNGEKGDVEPAYMASTVKTGTKPSLETRFTLQSTTRPTVSFATTRATTI